MNFLAHLHIADDCQSSLLGNLLGDFVKGDPYRYYPTDIADGIRLHRWVDSFTDRHPATELSKRYFSDGTRRYAGIALDMMWDHFLAKRWPQYSDLSLEQFCRQAQQSISQEHQLCQPQRLPERYLAVSAHMWRGCWLTSYRELDNIQLALERMSLRSPRMAPLANCFDVLEQHYSVFSEQFDILYQQVLFEAQQRPI
ncbi:ACP phosphodiesterase [Vibrio sp.]|uniref:acyl carrier protein phosphodiesterase n=1 Tax=Vibrio sp. TaxID=678 RepID=UPI003D10F148